MSANHGRDARDSSITKNIALEGFTLPKICWVQEHEPDNWQKVQHPDAERFLSIVAIRYLFNGLFGCCWDITTDSEKNCWSAEILNKFAIPEEILPTLLNQ